MLPPSSITKIELVRVLFLFSYQTNVRISNHGQKIGFLTDFELLKLCADNILELD